MNPTTGTFTSMDTYGGSVFDPTSLHKYLYANANPVSYTDPSGYFSLGEAVTVMAVSTVLGGIISGGYELFHQLASGTKWSDLNWERIKDATIKGLLAGFGIGILIVIAEAFAVAAIYEVLGYLAAYTGGKFVGLAIIDVIVYRNWKLAALDLGMALFSFWGAKKSFERAPVMSEKRAAKAAKTAESATDTSVENNSTAGEKSGTNDSKNPIFGDEWYKYFNEKYGKGNVNWKQAKIEDIFNDPSRIVDFTPEQVAEMAREAGWSVEPLGKGSKAGIPYEKGGGYSMRAPNGGSEYIQYHPGGGHHGEAPYFKVSSGPTGTLRFFLGDD